MHRKTESVGGEHLSLNGSHEHQEHALRTAEGRQKDRRGTLKDFQFSTMWASTATSLQCSLQRVATNFYLPYKHAL